MGLSAVTSLCPSCCILDSLDLEIHMARCFPAIFMSSLQDRTCMSSGLKTPKRYQLLISNTAFKNFDVNTCTAIRTCSGCYQGQGESDLHFFSRLSTVPGFLPFHVQVHTFHRQPLIGISAESHKKSTV